MWREWRWGGGAIEERGGGGGKQRKEEEVKGGGREREREESVCVSVSSWNYPTLPGNKSTRRDTEAKNSDRILHMSLSLLSYIPA